MTESGPGLTAELVSVIAGARRRASRDDDRQIDTAHLLHSLLEADPDAAEAFGGPPEVARLLGYLVQRSIGYGLRWQGTVEDSGTLPVVWAAQGVPGWSPAAVAAMERAGERAERRGEPRARGVDLLAALAADGDCRAVEVMRRAGADPGRLVGWLDELERLERLERPGRIDEAGGIGGLGGARRRDDLFRPVSRG